MRRPMFLLLVAVAVLAMSCSDDSPTGPGTITGSGTLITETRTLDPIHSISVRIPAEVELRSGSEQSVKVTVDDNIIENVETLVRDGVLIIRSNTAASLSDYDLLVEVTMTDLQTISVPSVAVVRTMNQFDVDDVELDFTGTVTASLNLSVNTLTTVATGTVMLNLNGSADTHECDLDGTTTMSAFGFFTTTTNLSIEGTGQIQIQASDQLTVLIAGTANVFYKGHPTVDSTITGFGSLTDAN